MRILCCHPCPYKTSCQRRVEHSHPNLWHLNSVPHSCDIQTCDIWTVFKFLLNQFSLCQLNIRCIATVISFILASRLLCLRFWIALQRSICPDAYFGRRGVGANRLLNPTCFVMFAGECFNTELQCQLINFEVKMASYLAVVSAIKTVECWACFLCLVEYSSFCPWSVYIDHQWSSHWSDFDGHTLSSRCRRNFMVRLPRLHP